MGCWIAVGLNYKHTHDYVLDDSAVVLSTYCSTTPLCLGTPFEVF